MLISLIRQTATLVIAAVATLVVIAASAAPAQAAATTGLRVDISGYNLASDHGRDLAAALLRRAATQVCHLGDTRSLASLAATRACTTAALARAMPNLDMQVAAARDGRTDVAANERRGSRAGTGHEMTPVTR
jgi:UrcA family protein